MHQSESLRDDSVLFQLGTNKQCILIVYAVHAVSNIDGKQYISIVYGVHAVQNIDGKWLDIKKELRIPF